MSGEFVIDLTGDDDAATTTTTDMSKKSKAQKRRERELQERSQNTSSIDWKLQVPEANPANRVNTHPTQQNNSPATAIEISDSDGDAAPPSRPKSPNLRRRNALPKSTVPRLPARESSSGSKGSLRTSIPRSDPGPSQLRPSVQPGPSVLSNATKSLSIQPGAPLDESKKAKKKRKKERKKMKNQQSQQSDSVSSSSFAQTPKTSIEKNGVSSDPPTVLKRKREEQAQAGAAATGALFPVKRQKVTDASKDLSSRSSSVVTKKPLGQNGSANGSKNPPSQDDSAKGSKNPASRSSSVSRSQIATVPPNPRHNNSFPNGHVSSPASSSQQRVKEKAPKASNIEARKTGGPSRPRPSFHSRADAIVIDESDTDPDHISASSSSEVEVVPVQKRQRQRANASQFRLFDAEDAAPILFPPSQIGERTSSTRGPRDAINTGAVEAIRLDTTAVPVGQALRCTGVQPEDATRNIAVATEQPVLTAKADTAPEASVATEYDTTIRAGTVSQIDSTTQNDIAAQGDSATQADAVVRVDAVKQNYTATQADVNREADITTQANATIRANNSARDDAVIGADASIQDDAATRDGTASQIATTIKSSSTTIAFGPIDGQDLEIDRSVPSSSPKSQSLEEPPPLIHKFACLEPKPDVEKPASPPICTSLSPEEEHSKVSPNKGHSELYEHAPEHTGVSSTAFTSFVEEDFGQPTITSQKWEDLQRAALEQEPLSLPNNSLPVLLEDMDLPNVPASWLKYVQPFKPQPTEQRAQSPLRNGFTFRSYRLPAASPPSLLQPDVVDSFDMDIVTSDPVTCQQPRDFLQLDEVQKAIATQLKELHDDQEYKVQVELTRAHTRPAPTLKALLSALPSAAPNGMMGIAHQVSPFQDMQAIEVPIKAKDIKGNQTEDHINMAIERYKGNKLDSKSFAACPVATYTSTDTPILMPNYTHYVGLRRNILGENSKQMHVWPYFQFEETDTESLAEMEETAHAELRKQFDADVNDWPRKVYRSQQVQTYTPYVEAFLDEIGSSMSDVLYYVLEPDEGVASLALEGCPDRRFWYIQDMDNPSPRWIKALSTLPKPSHDALRKAALAYRAFQEALKTSTLYHEGLTLWDIARKSAIAHLLEDSQEHSTSPCLVCNLHDCPYHGEIDSDDTSDPESIATADARDADYPPSVNYKISLTQPTHTHEPKLSHVARSMQPQREKYKKKSIDWWFTNPSTNSTWDHSKRGPFFPCSHPGQTCNQAHCRCFREKVACEKACGCSTDCDRRFRGCSCNKGTKKRCWEDDRCDCYRLNRECDPDLCGTCGVSLILDRENQDNEELLDSCCRNAGIQLGQPKRTLLGKSTVHGFGLFAGEDLKQGDFIGEYKGEVIGISETDRRDTVYGVQKSSYLFTLNRDQSIDSQRYGNKMRFINHANPEERRRNVYPKIMSCNMVQRIGMFALKDIDTRTEMFFDYGKTYDKALVSKTLLRLEEDESDGEVTYLAAPKTASRKRGGGRSRGKSVGPPLRTRTSTSAGSDISKRSTSNIVGGDTKRPAARKSDQSSSIRPTVSESRRSIIGSVMSRIAGGSKASPLAASPLTRFRRIVDSDDEMEQADVKDIPVRGPEDDESEYEDAQEEEVVDSEDGSRMSSGRERRRSTRARTSRRE